MPEKLTLPRVKRAVERLTGIIHRTPLEYSETFSALTGKSIFLKLENFQKTGSFKIRGAYNAIAGLAPAEREKGVLAASAGNHAQGVAYAARLLGIKATIVMPETAPVSKVMATESYGAKVVLAGTDYDGAYRKALELQKTGGAVYIHGFDDYRIMAGQGTISLELMEQLPDVDAVVVPVGGGGLVAGLTFVLKQLRPLVTVIGVQAEGAPAVWESMRAGELREVETTGTIADGIAVGSPGGASWEVINKYVDDMVTVSDEEISRALLYLLERAKLVVEGAGAAGLAALLEQKINFPGQKAAVLISGGNIDSHLLSVIIERCLIKEGRRVRLGCLLPDRPGSLQSLLTEISHCRSNVISIIHDRINPGVPLKKARVEMELETRNRHHIIQIVELLREKGYLAKEL